MANLNLAIVFDFGNVLVDWNPRYLYRKLFAGDETGMERFLAEVDFHSFARQYDLERPPAEILAEYSDRFPQYAPLFQAYEDRFLESIGGPIQPSVDLLHELKRAGYPLYGLSNWSSAKFKLYRKGNAFFDLFDDMVVSGDVRVIKPDPRIFEILLQRANRRAQDCIFIDDHLPNVDAARQLGFRAIQFRSGEQLRAELGKMGVFV
jgi:2-haloacid dehalogenase